MNIWFNGAGAENVKGKDKRDLPLRYEDAKKNKKIISHACSPGKNLGI